MKSGSDFEGIGRIWTRICRICAQNMENALYRTYKDVAINMYNTCMYNHA